MDKDVISTPKSGNTAPVDMLNLMQEVWYGLGKIDTDISGLKEDVSLLKEQAAQDRSDNEKCIEEMKRVFTSELNASISQLSGFIYAGKAINLSWCLLSAFISSHQKAVIILALFFIAALFGLEEHFIGLEGLFK